MVVDDLVYLVNGHRNLNSRSFAVKNWRNNNDNF